MPGRLTAMKVSIPYKAIIILLSITGIFAKCSNDSNIPENSLYPKRSAVEFSQQYLLAVKSDEPFDAYQDTLAALNLDSLKVELNAFNDAQCFWINTYNALVQTKAKDNSKSFENRNAFFKAADILIGGTNISLDNIEHNILRGIEKGQNDFTNTFKLERLDNRLHFALNCGAAACPPIAFYSADRIDQQLNLAEEIFILSASKFDTLTGILETSKILDWYRDDFNGDSGIIDLMKKHGVVSNHSVTQITYTPYDWTLDLNNY
jgi:hypothetical protein